MTSASGVSCDLEINMGSPIPEDSWTVFGTLGMARWSSASGRWDLQYVQDGTLKELSLQTAQAAENRAYSREGQINWIKESIPVEKYPPEDYYNYIYDYFAGGQPPFVPLSDPLGVMRWMEECRKK